MAKPMLEDAFAHHVWATLKLMDVCSSLSAEQLESPVPGTYGSVLDMLRHIVGADAWYLFVLTAGRVVRIDEDTMDLAELRALMEGYGQLWRTILVENADPDAEVVAHRDDGSEGHATAGIRLAQVVHHGTDHRSQICTGLTALGMEPPEIDVWAFGERRGRVFDVPPPA